ncbi:glycosyltransferase family 4 protein [Atopobacter phocae]|uniref:glycosyltransferase family 4 protein n=1 Tax=Atopobacter phocae TaxID=136492 RepID=UPI0004702E60|nr:glycosyltransferase family 4 protein [Atopobacter phocae]
MKVLLWTELENWVSRSGLGRAIIHQRQALNLVEVEHTSKWEDPTTQIAHINTYFPFSVWLARKLKQKKVPVIMHGHSTVEDFRNSFIGSNLLAPLFKKWLIYAYQSGNAIITPTPYSKALIESYGDMPPVYVVSNGINLKLYNRDKIDPHAFRKKYHLNADQPVIISVGMWIERKGILDWIKLAQSMPEVTFIWFGETPLWQIPSHVRQAIKTAPDNAIFPGYVPASELREAYVGCDAFVFLTQEETEGIVLLEALALKVPTIVRDIPIYREWFIDNEHVLKGKQVEDFKQAILSIKSNPTQTKKRVEQSYQLIQKNDLNEIGTQLKQIYEQMIENH